MNGRRATPTLFDRVAFNDLLRLAGDTGGRALLTGYRVDSVEWPDRRLLLDVDTPGDYARLIGSE